MLPPPAGIPTLPRAVIPVRARQDRHHSVSRAENNGEFITTQDEIAIKFCTSSLTKPTEFKIFIPDDFPQLHKRFQQLSGESR